MSDGWVGRQPSVVSAPRRPRPQPRSPRRPRRGLGGASSAGDLGATSAAASGGGLRRRRSLGGRRGVRPAPPMTEGSASALTRSASIVRAACASGAGEQRGGLRQRRLHGAGELGEQHLARLEVGELGDLVGGQRLAVEHAALDHEQRVCLGEVTQTLGRLDRVAVDEGDRRRARRAGRRDPRRRPPWPRSWSACSSPRRRWRVSPSERRSVLELRHGEPAVLGQHGRVRAAELLRELGDRSCLVALAMGLLPADAGREGPGQQKRPGAGAGAWPDAPARRGAWSSPARAAPLCAEPSVGTPVGGRDDRRSSAR